VKLIHKVLNVKNIDRCKHILWKRGSSFCVDVMFQTDAFFPLLCKSHGTKPSACHTYINTELHRHALHFSRWNYARETGNCLVLTDSVSRSNYHILFSDMPVIVIKEKNSNALIPPSALNSIVINKSNRQLTRVFCWTVMVLNKVLHVLLNIQKYTYEISLIFFQWKFQNLYFYLIHDCQPLSYKMQWKSNFIYMQISL
jgi:hypothetical protein